MIDSKTKLKLSDGQALVAEFYQSEFKPGAFCAKKNIPYHVLKYWRDRCKGQGDASEPQEAKFVPVNILKSVSSPQPVPIKIMLSNRMYIEVPNGADLLLLKNVIAVCIACG